VSETAPTLEPQAVPPGVAPGPGTRRGFGWRRAVAWLWTGHVVSHFGDSLYLVGIFFLALEVTGSKSLSGLLIALHYLPALALGAVAGVYVDRHDRRRVMLAAELIRFSAAASIPALYLTGRLTPWALGLAMFALATGSTLFNPAMKAITPELVPGRHLAAVATGFQLSEFAAMVAGPALAAMVIVPELGSIHLFSLNAATFLVSGLCVLALAPIARRTAHGVTLPPRDQRTSTPTPSASVWQEAWRGVGAVLEIPVLRALLAFVALDNLLLTGLAQVATPLLVKERLGLGTEGFAGVQTLFFLGLLAASAGFWALGRRLPPAKTILVGIVLDGLTFVPLAFCRTLGELQLAMFLHALALPLIIIPRTVLIQQLVPGPLHGRAFALVHVTIFGMTAVSAGVTGWLAERVSLGTLFAVLGSLGAAVGFLGFRNQTLRGAR